MSPATLVVLSLMCRCWSLGLLVLTGHKKSHSINSWPRHHLLLPLISEQRPRHRERLNKSLLLHQLWRRHILVSLDVISSQTMCFKTGHQMPVICVSSELKSNSTSSKHSGQALYNYIKSDLMPALKTSLQIKTVPQILRPTPLRRHNKYIYKTTKDSLNLLEWLGGLGIGGCNGYIEDRREDHSQPANALSGNIRISS